jgi:sterol desaturase/sphingolipid hydroxylase (fatty acid hydroxylase superfamily)
MVSLSLSYQFFVHTELVPHIHWLEWIINTPSAHRVHHASNPEYLDKNYGGVLLIWDHLFGAKREAKRWAKRAAQPLLLPPSLRKQNSQVCGVKRWRRPIRPARTPHATSSLIAR